MTALLDDVHDAKASDWLRPYFDQGLLKTFPPRTIFIHEGGRGDLIYLVKSGRGKIYSTSATGKEIVLGVFGPGTLLGELTLDGGGRMASVMTLEKTVCQVVPLDDFKRLIAGRPDLAMDMIVALIGLLRASNEHVKSLAFEDVYGRVVRLLMKEAVVEDDHWIVEQRMTQQEIADRVGCSREMVSRIFKALEISGCIQVQRDRISIYRKPSPGW